MARFIANPASFTQSAVKILQPWLVEACGEVPHFAIEAGTTPTASWLCSGIDYVAFWVGTDPDCRCDVLRYNPLAVRSRLRIGLFHRPHYGSLVDILHELAHIIQRPHVRRAINISSEEIRERLSRPSLGNSNPPEAQYRTWQEGSATIVEIMLTVQLMGDGRMESAFRMLYDADESKLWTPNGPAHVVAGILMANEQR